MYSTVRIVLVFLVDAAQCTVIKCTINKYLDIPEAFLLLLYKSCGLTVKITIRWKKQKTSKINIRMCVLNASVTKVKMKGIINKEWYKRKTGVLHIYYNCAIGARRYCTC